MSEAQENAMGCFGAIIGFMLGAGVVGFAVNDNWKAKSVEGGHAEYVLEGSEAVWQWKEPKPAINKEQP